MNDSNSIIMVINWFNATYSINPANNGNLSLLYRNIYLHGDGLLLFYLKHKNIPPMLSIMILGWILSLLNLRKSQVYIANKKSKSLSLELSVEISGKVHFIRVQTGKVILSPESQLKKKPIYRLGSNLNVIFDNLTKTEQKYLDDHLENYISRYDPINASKYVCENAIPRYFHVKDDSYDFMKDGLRYCNKDRLEKLRSKDSWLTQFGRVIKCNEIPTKTIALKRKENIKNQDLYAEWQTELYVPPEVNSDEEIPKNDHGNINLYTADMLPNNCVWLTNPIAKLAAEKLDINYAQACTGFKFRSGRATPNVVGIVFHQKYQKIIERKIEELHIEYERKDLWENEKLASIKWCRLLESILNSRRLSAVSNKCETDFSILQQKKGDFDMFDDI